MELDVNVVIGCEVGGNGVFVEKCDGIRLELFEVDWCFEFVDMYVECG